MSNSDHQNEKRQIKIYQRTYFLPILGGGKLDGLQTDIRNGSENLQRGYIVKKVYKEITVEEKGFFFGKKLVTKVVEELVEQKLKFEERFQELDSLVRNYDAVIEALNEHQGEYQQFFEAFADEIRKMVTLKCQEIALVEQDRLEVECIAQIDNDDDLFQIAAQQKAEILETAKSFGYAAILMLKKLDLMSASLEKIANDQQTQREVLESMVKKLTGQKKAYEVQLKIRRLQAEASELTQIALNFESYMEKFIGSFQTLLGNVSMVDKDLSGAMEEIKQIAELAMSKQSLTIEVNDQSSQKILDFLVASDLKKERLIDALERSRDANSEIEFDCNLKNEGIDISLTDCLENIQAYVQFELSPILTSQKEWEQKDTKQFSQNELEQKKYDSKRSLDEFSLEFVDIPAGSFMMGDSNGDEDEKPAHLVIFKAFKMSKYPITQFQYQVVMGNNPAYFQSDSNCPVENISWNDARKFCERLSGITGQTVQLPSESQWEYACRAGGTGKYGFGYSASQLGKYAWTENNSENKTHSVGEKSHNKWGLYDMHGNVWEWCEDVWHDNYNDAPNNGSAWVNGGEQSQRVLRGGSWNVSIRLCRSANRGRSISGNSGKNVGFRIVLV
jgi:formylglycine-generating enzyme required for sulfatase activity